MKKLLSKWLCLTSLLLGFVSCKNETASVTGIYFTNVPKGRLVLAEGEDYRINYEVEPQSLKKTASLTWTTSNPDVATVRRGIVYAQYEGEAVITATCDQASASVKVLVEAVEVTNFNLPSSVAAFINTPVQVELSNLEPENASLSGITWKIGDPSVANYSISSGKLYVTGLRAGSTTLTGTCKNCTRQCKVVIDEYVPVTSIAVTPQSGEISVGEKTTLSVSVLPNNASMKEVEWSISPAELATFDKSTLTLTAGEKTGTVVITAQAKNENIKGTASVTIVPAKAQTLRLQCPAGVTPYGHMSPGGKIGGYPATMTLQPKVTPEAANPTIKWKSLDPTRATVDQNGVVTAVGHGTVLIEADADGIKAYAMLRCFKEGASKWQACMNENGGAPLTSISYPGTMFFYVYDPAAYYKNTEGGESFDSNFYLYEDTEYKPVSCSLPDGFAPSITMGNPTHGFAYYPTKFASGNISINMGVGDVFKLYVSSTIQTVSLVTPLDEKLLFTVSNGATYTLNRSSLEYATIYDIKANCTNHYANYISSLWWTVYTCSPNNIYDTSTRRIRLGPNTPTGTYIIALQPDGVWYSAMSGNIFTFNLKVQ